jgi:glutathione S-transferase
MNDSIILHHYENSPYAEKIRLMFGLTNSGWNSLLSPFYPPRPNVDPLTGGYRRIPVAQIDADIFCDSALIAQEVAVVTGKASLDLATVEGDALVLMKQAEEQVFFAAVSAVPKSRLVAAMLRQFGPMGAYRFVKDRTSLMSGGTSRPPSPEKAKLILRAFLDALEAKLSACAWVGGDAPSVADFACYHPLWLHLSCSGKPLNAGQNVLNWYKAVSDIGHGQRREITQAEAFEVAKASEPRALPTNGTLGDFQAGQVVQIAPIDYGVVPVTGTLAAVTESRIIIARESSEFGTLHVHFPREGYALVAGKG